MNINNNMKGSPMRPIWQTPTPQQPTVAVVTSLAANQALASLMVGNGYVPPVLTTSGTDVSGGTGTTKIVTGSATLPTYTSGSGVYISQVTVTLSGSAIFSSGSTYHVLATLRTNGANAEANIQVQYNSASSFTLYSVSPGLLGSATVDFLAIGY